MAGWGAQAGSEAWDWKLPQLGLLILSCQPPTTSVVLAADLPICPSTHLPARPPAHQQHQPAC